MAPILAEGIDKSVCFCYNCGMEKKATCHPNLKHRARGLCWTCNEKWRATHNTVTMATCHPSRRVSIKKLGLCKSCAEKWRYDNVPGYAEKKKAAAKAWRKANVDKRRLSNRLGKYKISVDDYERLVVEHNGKCAICGEPFEVIDHDHDTNLVRGLLCHACNKGLGHFKDDLTLIKKALEYLA